MSLIDRVLKMGVPHKCYLCGKPIIGSYYVDWNRHEVCTNHKFPIPHCVSCGQYCNNTAIDIGTGALLCSYCQKHMITKADCTHIINFIRNIYDISPIGSITNWHLKVVNAPALYNMTGDINTRGLAHRYGNDYTIFIFRYLSKVQFANVLAHEMLHIWQFNRNIRASAMYMEGFCNLGSYVVMKTINNVESNATIARMANDQDPIYGEGFRLMKCLFEQGQWESAINELINNHS